MAVADNFHSRMVGWAKIILPMAALILLSTLFLFGRTIKTTDDIPYAEIDELAREQQITAPKFSGITSNGAILQISAQSAKPQDGNLQVLVVIAPRLSLAAADGTTMNIVAGEGAVDGTAKTAQFTGLARLETSTGYLMETAGLVADLQTGEVNSLGPLAIRSPFGDASAGQVRIHFAEDGTGQQILFTQGVKLVYTPPSDEKDE